MLFSHGYQFLFIFLYHNIFWLWNEVVLSSTDIATVLNIYNHNQGIYQITFFNNTFFTTYLLVSHFLVYLCILYIFVFIRTIYVLNNFTRLFFFFFLQHIIWYFLFSIGI
jgi:hypothetical protein